MLGLASHWRLQMRELQDTSELHDYTELVIELWTAYMVHGFNLSELGGGDSREGIDRIQHDAIYFQELVETKESEGWWWDGGWIEAVQSWAHWIAQMAKYGNFSQPQYDITKYMEPKETK